MNNPNTILIPTLQKKIAELQKTYQEKIDEFSKISMENSARIRQQKSHQGQLAKIEQNIQSLLVSKEDFDTQIKRQEELLAEETQKEKALNEMIAQRQQLLKDRSFIIEIQQSKQREELELSHEYSAKQSALHLEKSKLLQQIEEYKETAQQLIQANQDLSSANETLSAEVCTQETEMIQHFRLRTMSSIFHLSMEEIYTIQQKTSQLDLFYATSFRLGVIYHLQKNTKQAFKYLSYLPSELLHWYQIHETYETIKLDLLKSFFLPYSSQTFFERAQTSRDIQIQEILLILAIQACSEQNEINQPAYLNLLQMYLDRERWLHAYLLIKKIRGLDTKPAKSFLPVNKIILAFCQANESPLIASKFIKFDQMYSIMGNIPELRDIRPSYTLQLDETIPTLHQDIFFLNHGHEIIECHSTFLNLWCQYQQGLTLIKSGLISQAIGKFRQILSEHPFFIEAYLKLAEYTQEPIWQHLSYQKT